MRMSSLKPAYTYTPPMRDRETPAWDNVLDKLERLQACAELPDKPARMLLDPNILSRLPNSARRAVKGTHEFMQRWLLDEQMRKTFKMKILERGNTLSGVMFIYNAPDQQGNILVSVTTHKGFITVQLTH